MLILGSGPNRIGQGIEFDYCCVQAVRSYRRQGYAAVMVNCNPETVSTDYDTADRLYFEPLTAEDVLEVVEREQPVGVVVQFGGQTPLKLARRLVETGVPILGTSPAAIDLAEDRERFGDLLARARPARSRLGDRGRRRGGRRRRRAHRLPGARAPVLRARRPGDARLLHAPTTCAPRRSRPTRSSTASSRTRSRSTSTRSATASDAIVAAVMEHVEEAGVHSGDSACVIPPLSIGPELEAEIRRQTELLVRGLGVQGLCNVQFALHEGTIYVLEANPRASRTVPFVCKAMGIDLVDLACRVTTGSRLAEMKRASSPSRASSRSRRSCCRSRASPARIPCWGRRCARRARSWRSRPTSPTTYAKAMRAAGLYLPARPNGQRAVAFLSVCDRDKPAATLLAQRLADLGFDLVATPGTARRIAAARHRGDRGREGGGGGRQLGRRPRARRARST